MALSKNVVGGGFSPGQAKALNGAIATGLTAAGTTITDAFALVADSNIIGTCGSGAGVKLPSCELGDSCEVYNGGANSCKVYPDSSTAQINGTPVGTGIVLATNTACMFRRITTTRWIAILSA